MMKKILFLLTSFALSTTFAQNTPNNCNGAVPGCTTPSFPIQPNNPATNIVDFGTGTISNPSSPPYGNNSGCLLSGETSSTFITISVVSSGTLQWSIIGLNPTTGAPSNTGCFDWIMWPYTGPTTTCAGLSQGTLPPVACNWNGTCNGNTGMAAPGNLPPNGSNSSYVAPLNVVAGQTYLLCLSNYSGVSQNVNLNFFGTANVACEPSAPDQTICLGNSATVTIATPGLPNPSFQWIVTTGVSNPTGGTNVQVTPTVTTDYQVVVTNPPTMTAPAFVDTVDFTITVATPPAPYAGPDQTVCFGTPILLTGTEGNAANTSSWNSILPTGLTPAATASFSPNFSSLTPTVTVNQPGLYKFVFREVTTVCGTMRDTVQVNVVKHTQTVAKTDPSCGGYTDGSITITSAAAVEYSFDNGTTWQTSNTSSGFGVGTYNVCSKNALGCQACSPITLVAPPPVTIQVSNDTLICENGTASLTATGGGNGTVFTYIWGHSSETTSNVEVSPTADTYYDVIAVSQTGCQSPADSIYVTVRDGLSGDGSAGVTICPGYPEAISASALGGIGAPYTFTWSSGEVETGTTSSISPNPTSTQTFTVTIEDACESTPIQIPIVVTVSPLPVPQFAAVDSSICEPAIFELYNLTDPSMVAATTWNISDGQFFVNQDQVTTVEMYEGSYNVQLIVVSPEGCVDSVTYVGFLNSNPKPVADFKWSPNPVQMFNTNVMFANQSVHGYTYQWTFESGTPSTSNLENPKITFPDGEVGQYLTTLITTSPYGCMDTMQYTVAVLPEVILYVPNAFTPDDDEFNQDWKIFMEGVDVTQVTINVFDRWGIKVWESHDLDVPWDGTYNGEILPVGTYTWTISAKDAINDARYEYNGHVSILR